MKASDIGRIKDWIKANGYKGVPDWWIKELTGFDIRKIRRALLELEEEPVTQEDTLKYRAEIERLTAPEQWHIL